MGAVAYAGQRLNYKKERVVIDRLMEIVSTWRHKRTKKRAAIARLMNITSTWRHKRDTAQPHGLPIPLIVSLTSYPGRFHVLHHTLHCLLAQSVRPDHLILWLAHADAEKLPPECRVLEAEGVEVRLCEDMRSYKKLIPALEAFPDAAIVTADDDVFYEFDWLEVMVRAYSKCSGDIPCHRAHRIIFAEKDRPAHYSNWKFSVSTPCSGADLFPTGVGGVLYGPGVLHPDVMRVDLFQKLCPTADDIWFYWMGRLAGSTPRKVGPRFHSISWPGSQDSSLRELNIHGGANDRQIRAMIGAYGFPPLTPP